MEDPPGAKHLPTLDYVKHQTGAYLPLPVREDDFNDRQRDAYLIKKKSDKEEENEIPDLLEKDTEENAYDQEAADSFAPYKGIAYRNDFEIWYGDLDDPEEYQDGLLRAEKEAESNPDQPKIAKGLKDAQKFDTKKRSDCDEISAPTAKKFVGKKRGAGQKKRIPGSLGATIPIRRFDINFCQRWYTNVFYGRRGSGKSFLMGWLLYKLRKLYPRGLCVTKTPENGFWQKMIPDDFVHEDLNEMVLREFLEVQKDITKLAREKPEAQINPNAFLILEDCVDQNFRFNTVVERVFYLGRHRSIGCFIASQWCHALHPGVRSNADLVFIFQLHSIAEQKHIWETYFGFMPFDDFQQLMSRFTGKRTIDGKDRHLFLGINCRVKEVCRTDSIFWGFAEETPPFILGCAEFWADAIEDKHEGMIEKHELLKHPRRLP